ncbi:hypothetical protein P879_11815 [Paragonimus westermani]|uniref:Uncharacterized protein n=1 Tax=Paragonimus westermani TaxID=34504 RepID=A0A8T0D4M9_9TREM|nr:hypothetical protein P879_11815 [Paragonimus westermani]
MPWLIWLSNSFTAAKLDGQIQFTRWSNVCHLYGQMEQPSNPTAAFDWPNYWNNCCASGTGQPYRFNRSIRWKSRAICFELCCFNGPYYCTLQQNYGTGGQSEMKTENNKFGTCFEPPTVLSRSIKLRILTYTGRSRTARTVDH